MSYHNVNTTNVPIGAEASVVPQTTLPNFPHNPYDGLRYEWAGVTYTWDTNRWVANNHKYFKDRFVDYNLNNYTQLP